MIDFITINSVNEQEANDIFNLVVELDQRREKSNVGQLNKLLQNDNLHFIVAKHKNSIIGIGVLMVFDLIGERRGRIEDLIVKKEFRRLGIGENICRLLIGVGKNMSIKCINLASNKTRRDANLLYQKIGFEYHHTNSYFYNII